MDHFIVHARKCLLKGLDPKQNRTVPPLKYDYVLRLKQDLPHLHFSINGGFKTKESIQDILAPEKGLVGCMVGRAAYESPWLLSDFDSVFYGRQNPGYTRRELLEIYGEYGDYELARNPRQPLPPLIKPIQTLLVGERHNKVFRGFLSDRLNFGKSGNCFSEFVQNAILTYESVAKECKEIMDAPPGTFGAWAKGGDVQNEE